MAGQLLLLLLLLTQGGRCLELTYDDPGEEMSYFYSEPEELHEEENRSGDCGNGYYDQMALLCWPKFHATIMATAEKSRCHWGTIGSMYSELSICAGLLAESMGCPLPSSTLDAFFLSIHRAYFGSCALPIRARDHQLPTGAIIALAALPVCLVPLSVALTLRRASSRPDPAPLACFAQEFPLLSSGIARNN